MRNSLRVRDTCATAESLRAPTVAPTTAAQYFHVLRRQVKLPWRKPLVVLTPKSMIHENLSMSSLDECSVSTFQRVLGDERLGPGCKPERVLLGTGKIMLELLKLREEQGREDIGIVRLEQLYPLPKNHLEAALEHVPDGTPVFWVQEEPANMGAAWFIKVNFGDSIQGRWPLTYISRPESASPSTGSKKMHKIEQEELWERAMTVQQTVPS